MNNLYLAELGVPCPGQDAGAIAAAFDGVLRLQRRMSLDLLGHADLTESLGGLLTSYPQQQVYEKVWLLVARGTAPTAQGRFGLPVVSPDAGIGADDIVAATVALLPRTDNAHLVTGVELLLDQSAGGSAAPAMLLDAVEGVARRAGRTLVSSWNHHRVAEPGTPGALTSASDPQAAAPNERSDLFLARGYRVVQIERHSTMPLDFPVPPVVVAPGYRLVSWSGPSDPARHQDLADLETAICSDAPNGESGYIPEVWDADRWATSEADTLAHNQIVTTAAQHIDSGRLVAYSQLIRDPDNPQAVFQGTTVVLDAHRGHGLGYAVKCANVDLARAAWPDARRVHTWNAGENDHMWLINERLGYRTASLVCAFEGTIG